ncbi:DNA-binding transcriptional regulator, XRE-family HTH domain [Pedobacter westerhofensis]|uniref:DNA-binding transcriptional regulator, XRE-family HTH domain n=1 Tax=Pedobacter westerhofensis TaxID=425512 RepID=A0A521AP79_9SPHI|nr:helix-turn-helix transcriptional regulator [Pedobacter westerhofensis]SMO36633.1 DNA-binding transcriptional regulator, XRE-family HTH domain [Pedobacter westerhofensis]
MQEILSKKILGERIKSLRLEKSYAQAYVADFLNLSRSNYSQIELGNQYPTFNTLNAISRHYNRSYEWLLHGEEEKQIIEIRQLNLSFVSIAKELESNLKNFSSSLKQLKEELEHLKKEIMVS